MKSSAFATWPSRRGMVVKTAKVIVAALTIVLFLGKSFSAR